MKNIYKLHREEWLPCAGALLVFVALNALMVNYEFDRFTRPGPGGFFTIFRNHFCISGFDVLTYIVLSQWRPLYSLYRHPLLSVLVWPLSQLNGWLMALTGMNCAVFIVAALFVVMDLYSFVFTYRIFRQAMQLSRADATLLSAFFFSFASILLTSFVPDHFAVSLFLLTMTLYVAGVRLRQGRSVLAWHTGLLFFFASGITLTNGVKVLLADLFVSGRRFFRPRHLLVAAAVPLLMLGAVYVWQDRTIMQDERHFQQQTTQRRMKKDAAFARRMEKYADEVKQRKDGQLVESPYFEYTDTRVSRWPVVVENLFGESIQLHRDHLLEDVNETRPAVVAYGRWQCYAVEAVVVALFLAGLWAGRRERLLWVAFSWFVFDMVLHLGLGFAITEVYIMGAHFLLAVPVAVACLLQRMPPRGRSALRVVLLFLSVYLFVYNGTLIFQHMTHT